MVEKTVQILKDNVRPLLPTLTEELNPPATQAQIDEVTSQLPFPLPDEVRQLYLIHNGEAKERGLFFGLPFIDVATALSEWKLFTEHASEDFSDIDADIVSVPAKQVKQTYINTHYFPISRDSGNYIVVDLDPDSEGTKGQIINYGRDEFTRYVIAPSLNDFLAFCIHQLEIGNYVVGEGYVLEEGNGKRLYLKEPNKYFLDALPQLDLPFRASNR